MIYILIISILPVFLIGLYIYQKDQIKEPKKLLKKLFLYGMLSCIPAAIIEIVIGNLFGSEENMNLIVLFLYVFISIALVEEAFKWIVVYRLSYNDQAFDELYDAIVYATFVSLGFACFENIFYVLDAGIMTGIMRAITAIPAHTSDAIIMGNFLGLAKLAKINNNNKLCRKNLLLSIIMPTLIHTIYDYCLITQNTIFLLIFAVFLVSIYIYSIKKIKRTASNKVSLVNKENIVYYDNINYCPNCGTPSNGNYCVKCGSKLKSI